MTTESQPKVSVVRYLNTAPLVWGMLKGEQKAIYDLDFTTPACCADAVRQGEAEVGIIPSIEYQRIEGLRILPGLSIASKGIVKSVLLFSKAPIERVQTIAVDNSSRTSVALLRVLVSKFYARTVQFIPSAPQPAGMLEKADAALVIGDPALVYDGRIPYVYDLAAEWKKFTGLPFVFAVWAGRADGRIGHFCKDFQASRDYGLEHVNDIAREYGPKLNLRPEEVKVYLTENIDYSLDEENCRGLRCFYHLAVEAGILSGEKEISFA